MILFRKLWQRELKALAEGKPLTQWVRTPELRATFSESASNSEIHRPVESRG